MFENRNGVLSIGGKLLSVMPIETTLSSRDAYPTITCRIIRDYSSDSFIMRGRANAKTALFASNYYSYEPSIQNVIFNDPATIVFWTDGSKTVVKCQPGDTFSEELGLAMAIAKKFLGNTGSYNNVFKRFISNHNDDISVEEMRKKLTEYCHGRECLATECKLALGESICGKGVTFMSKSRGTYETSDDEVIRSYNRVFGEQKRSK